MQHTSMKMALCLAWSIALLSNGYSRSRYGDISHTRICLLCTSYSAVHRFQEERLRQTLDYDQRTSSFGQLSDFQKLRHYGLLTHLNMSIRISVDR